eukprot:CAMPEP_0170297894 /NCGR_PEP_ID=MMETSP0116_2-20130129/49114_1 /TAXON_ID=400756 /ORGANISM="Durinskia baltica, Strain CSIRO CS-38" /LENGTH=165 /DNA_ID=CAMNT_0010549531 /DNA_START=36 /DNA_END=530 /DNA_ORIENTATION=+
MSPSEHALLIVMLALTLRVATTDRLIYSPRAKAGVDVRIRTVDDNDRLEMQPPPTKRAKVRVRFGDVQIHEIPSWREAGFTVAAHRGAEFKVSVQGSGGVWLTHGAEADRCTPGIAFTPAEQQSLFMWQLDRKMFLCTSNASTDRNLRNEELGPVSAAGRRVDFE